jgi:hypothetical protein
MEKNWAEARRTLFGLWLKLLKIKESTRILLLYGLEWSGWKYQSHKLVANSATWKE